MSEGSKRARERDNLAVAGSEPKLLALLEEFRESVSNAAFWFKRMRVADDTRWCWWPGQSDDGLKHGENDEAAPFPWDGASDTRVRLVDRLAHTAIKICNAAYRRSRKKVNPWEVTDARQAGHATLLLRWLLESQMRDHAPVERRLALDWRVNYGVSVTQCAWTRETALALEEVDLTGLALQMGLGPALAIAVRPAQVASPEGEIDEEALRAVLEQQPSPLDQFLARVTQQGGTDEELAAYEELVNAMDLVTNEERNEEFVETLGQLYPTLQPKALKRAARELRKNGRAMLPVPYIVTDRPHWRALKVMQDVFFPHDTRTLQKARWICTREWLSIAELRERIVTEGYDEDWVAKVEACGGGLSSTDEARKEAARDGRWKNGKRVWDGVDESWDDMYEVLTFYYWAVDEYGIRGLYKTVMSAHLDVKPTGNGGEAEHTAVPGKAVKALCAKHELCDEYGAYPFVEHVFYRASEFLLENVGLPWLLYTYQNEVKAQRDYHIDYSSISILPPVRRHLRDADRPLILGPGSEVFEGISGQTDWMQPPNGRVEVARGLELIISDEADRYVGAWNERVPAPEVQLNQQELATDYLDEMVNLMSATLKLAQRELPDEIQFRLLGKAPVRMSREEIAGEFDIYVQFDARELDTEFAAQKAGQLIEIAKVDTEGRINRGRLVETLVNLLDPWLADETLNDPDEAAQQEIEDEQLNLVKMMAGVEPQYKEGGQNYQLRAEWLESQVNPQNPGANPKAVQLMQSDEMFQALVQNRLQHFAFMHEQALNRERGKIGVKEVRG